MTPTETAAILRQYNQWRRGNLEGMPQPDPREIGEAIDAAVEMIERVDRLEKVESALSALSYLLNDIEERAKWNLEAIQRVVACGNGVYVRAKAALEKPK